MKQNKVGSKERLFEIFRKVNKINLNEDNSNGTYFDTQSDAVEFAKNNVENRGFEVKDEDIANSKFGEGWVGYENTRRDTIPLYKNGKPQLKMLQISIYRMPSGKYELTSYIN